MTAHPSPAGITEPRRGLRASDPTTSTRTVGSNPHGGAAPGGPWEEGHDDYRPQRRARAAVDKALGPGGYWHQLEHSAAVDSTQVADKPGPATPIAIDSWGRSALLAIPGTRIRGEFQAHESKRLRLGVVHRASTGRLFAESCPGGNLRGVSVRWRGQVPCRRRRLQRRAERLAFHIVLSLNSEINRRCSAPPAQFVVPSACPAWLENRRRT